MAAMQRKELLAALPQSWRRMLGDFRFQSVEHGMSDARIFRLRNPASQTFYLKAAKSDAISAAMSDEQVGRLVRIPQRNRTDTVVVHAKCPGA